MRLSEKTSERLRPYDYEPDLCRPNASNTPKQRLQLSHYPEFSAIMSYNKTDFITTQNGKIAGPKPVPAT